MAIALPCAGRKIKCYAVGPNIGLDTSSHPYLASQKTCFSLEKISSHGTLVPTFPIRLMRDPAMM
jgi:hypothetical protein